MEENLSCAQKSSIGCLREEERAALMEARSAYLEQNRVPCTACRYCLPCPQGIVINQCARMSLMLRRAPTANSLNEQTKANMEKIDTCLDCGQCKSKCPYGLDTPALLRKNLEDYRRVLAGEVSVN